MACKSTITDLNKANSQSAGLAAHTVCIGHCDQTYAKDNVTTRALSCFHLVHDSTYCTQCNGNQWENNTHHINSGTHSWFDVLVRVTRKQLNLGGHYLPFLKGIVLPYRRSPTTVPATAVSTHSNIPKDLKGASVGLPCIFWCSGNTIQFGICVFLQVSILGSSWPSPPPSHTLPLTPTLTHTTQGDPTGNLRPQV